MSSTVHPPKKDSERSNIFLRIQSDHLDVLMREVDTCDKEKNIGRKRERQGEGEGDRARE